MLLTSVRHTVAE